MLAQEAAETHSLCGKGKETGSPLLTAAQRQISSVVSLTWKHIHILSTPPLHFQIPEKFKLKLEIWSWVGQIQVHTEKAKGNLNVNFRVLVFEADPKLSCRSAVFLD